MDSKYLKRIDKLIIVFACILYLLAFDSRLSLNGDNAGYIALGESISQGEGLRALWSPNKYISDYSHKFMLSAVLALIIKIFSQNLFIFKIMILLMALLSLYSLNKLLKSITTNKIRFSVLLLTALNPLILNYSHLVLTEIPYLLFSVVAIYFAYKSLSNPKKIDFNIVWTSIFICISLYTRVFGSVLALSIIIYLLIRKEYKKCVFIVASLLISFLGTYLITGVSYIGSVGETGQSVLIGSDKSPIFSKLYSGGYRILAYIGDILPDTILYPAFSYIHPRLSDGAVNPVFLIKFLAGGCLFSIILIGFAKYFREGNWLINLYIIFYAGILFFWGPYYSRLLIPIIPFLLLYLLEGSFTLFSHIQTKLVKFRSRNVLLISVYVIATIMAIIFIVGDIHKIYQVRTDFIETDEKIFIKCNDWIKDNTSKDSIVLSRKPRWTYVYTKHQSVRYLYSFDSDAQWQRLKNVDYIIVSPFKESRLPVKDSSVYYKDLVQKYPPNFRLIYKTKDNNPGYIYKVQ